jgi:hypothetical protein
MHSAVISQLFQFRITMATKAFHPCLLIQSSILSGNLQNSLEAMYIYASNFDTDFELFPSGAKVVANSLIHKQHSNSSFLSSRHRTEICSPHGYF